MMLSLALVLVGAAVGAPAATVEVEEDVYTYTDAANGSGPMWCSGSTCLVRVGEAVFASGIEVIEGAQPLNNVRWTLRMRDEDGWRLLRRDEEDRTREPSPLACFTGGPVFLSVNPTLTEPDAYNGPAEPRILAFDAGAPDVEPVVLQPGWAGSPAFTEHSYRSFAADGPNRELLLLQNIGYDHAEWALRDREGAWSAGQLVWPFGVDYAEPEPIRLCYPNVALHDRAVCFCGVSDIIEPNPEWRAYKKELTGQDWDYDFRRLFFAWTPDITNAPFSEWLEVASREETCGWIFPCDLWVGPDGRVHILWNERAIDERLRERFFPEAKQRHALEYAVIDKGEVVLRKTLAEGGEGLGGEAPGRARFHPTPDGRLLALYYTGGSDAEGRGLSENRLVEIGEDGVFSEATVVPFEHPFSSFFTATPRAGCPPSEYLDLLGECPGAPGAIRYARVQVG